MYAEWTLTGTLNSRASLCTPAVVVSHCIHGLLRSEEGKEGFEGQAAGEAEVTENEVRANVGRDITSVFGEPIGEFMRKGVLAGDMSNGMLWRLPRCLAGVLAAQ